LTIEEVFLRVLFVDISEKSFHSVSSVIKDSLGNFGDVKIGFSRKTKKTEFKE